VRSVRHLLAHRFFHNARLVWMAKVLAKYYPKLFDKEIAKRLASHVSKETRLSGAAYESISASMREYFGEYAGYAQQYLFHDARKSKLA